MTSRNSDRHRGDWLGLACVVASVAALVYAATGDFWVAGGALAGIAAAGIAWHIVRDGRATLDDLLQPDDDPDWHPDWRFPERPR